MEFKPVVPVEETFDSLYGLQIGEITPERVTATVAVTNRVKQPMGLVHGGVYASIAEAITSMGTARVVIEDGMSAQGLSNQTSFLRPIFEGTIHATATRRHRGRTTWVWEVDITDDAGRLCAVIRMTIAVRALPAQGAGSAGGMAT